MSEPETESRVAAAMLRHLKDAHETSRGTGEAYIYDDGDLSDVGVDGRVNLLALASIALEEARRELERAWGGELEGER